MTSCSQSSGVFSTIDDTRKLFENDPDVKFIRNGKVRDIFENTTTGEFFLVASDRISAFDRHLTTIPYKGAVLNKTSKWWFDMTRDIVPNHVIDDSHDVILKTKKCKVVPIEFVMRSYLTGSTQTSIWKNYEAGSRMYCGHALPDNMVRNQMLEKPLLTPTTKDEHDELISEKEILEQNIMTQEQWNTCKDYAFKLFEFGQKTLAEKNIILVDTKYEFGIDEDGNILLVDELHTPDSSRFWILDTYKERFESGQEPANFDKEVVRRWVKQNYNDPYDLSVPIDIPSDVRNELSNTYLNIYNMITGKFIDQ